MHARTTVLVGLSALVFAASGCSSGQSTMSVHLVDGPADYKEIDLDIQAVEIHSAAGWETLGTPKKVVNLLALRDGIEETLVNGASLPAGHYEQMRLVLGPNNSVVLQDGTSHALKVPSGMQSGVKFTVSFDVAENTTKDVFIDFDAHRSIFLHGAGASGQYLLRPVVRAVDKVVTGAVTGKLTDLATGTPLADVTVTAQTLDAVGTPTVVRSVRTKADGTYALDLLPVDGSYYVVSQPVVGATAYAAQAAGPFAITASAPVATLDGQFSVAAAGAITGVITPVAADGDGDVVSALQGFVVGGAPRTFVVRTEVATVGATGVESYTMAAMPVASYSVSASRQSVDASGNEVLTSASPATVSVLSGVTATASFAMP
jgi:hypothetical protein